MPHNRSQYYEELKELARDVRHRHGLSTPRVQLSDMRRIYKNEGITHIDYSPHLKNLRGAYFCDEHGPTVLLSQKLPNEPKIFTMGHELKHYLVDRELGLAYCDPSNVDASIEIGAEIFAAELIFPETMFIEAMRSISSKGSCTPGDLVHLKRSSRTTLSYAGLVKRAEFLRFSAPGAMAKVKWRVLEESMYGEPVYKRVLRHRARKQMQQNC